jgi:hypothetical protein
MKGLTLDTQSFERQIQDKSVLLGQTEFEFRNSTDVTERKLLKDKVSFLQDEIRSLRRNQSLSYEQKTALQKERAASREIELLREQALKGKPGELPFFPVRAKYCICLPTCVQSLKCFLITAARCLFLFSRVPALQPQASLGSHTGSCLLVRRNLCCALTNVLQSCVGCYHVHAEPPVVQQSLQAIRTEHGLPTTLFLRGSSPFHRASSRIE